MKSSSSRHCSVIVVNWNSWDVLATCLEKLAKQTYRNFSVILIDNASSTPKPENLETGIANSVVVLNTQNLGFAAANNQAIRMAQDSEWIATLNPDAFPEPDWLENLINAAGLHPEYAFFGSRQLVQGHRDVLDGDGDAYHLSGLVWREAHGRKVINANSSIPREIFSPCAAAALYRRDVLNEAGGFDEDFFCYVEDIDLGFRLRLLGYRCLLVPSAIVQHIGSVTTGGQRSDFAVYHGHRNLVWAYVKNMPAPLFWMLLPVHFAMNLATIFIYSLRGRRKLIIKAKKDALSGLPRMWAKRRQIQAKRRVTAMAIWRMLDKSLFRFIK